MINLAGSIKKYLDKSPEIKKWRLENTGFKGIDKVIVIPALSESASLLKTLASLSKNALDQLNSTLIICVINNREPGISAEEEIEDNHLTLKYLKLLACGMDSAPPPSCPDRESFTKVRSSGMKISYIDASTPGNELPEKGGVGLARKIGMDNALTALDPGKMDEGLIICLDADTLVDENYIEEIEAYFKDNEAQAAVLEFSHLLPEDKGRRAAAISYELYLRYYEAGLRYAGSPYAYQAIGSTMVCRAGAYVAIGGMNRKRAGEDFYFLQKLAKYGTVGRVIGTTVYPSMRISDRVPFGTGRKMGELAESVDKSIPFYNPDIFRVLKELIGFINCGDTPALNGTEALKACRKIDAALADYLDSKKLDKTWDKIKKNSKDYAQFKKNMHVWFDAFQTLKLAHHLRDNGYGTAEMKSALKTLFSMSGMDCEEGGAEQMLEWMRDKIFK